jgi:hypothetical protein
LRAAGCGHVFSDVQSGVSSYIKAMAAQS